MAVNSVPPVPYREQMYTAGGQLAPSWADWFKQVYQRIGGATGLAHIEADQIAASVAGTGLSGGNGTPLSATGDEWSKSLAASGYQELPSGLYIQWGVTGSVSTGATQSVTLPIAMPTGLLQAFSSIKDNSAVATTETGQWGTGNYSVSGFDIYNRTSAALTFNWFAIGY